MYTDVHVAGELHSLTAAVALPTCGEGVDVLRTRERERDFIHLTDRNSNNWVSQTKFSKRVNQ